MTTKDFIRILTCFSDGYEDDLVSDGLLPCDIRGDQVMLKLHRHRLGLRVEEEGVTWSAESWIMNRAARLPLLADRILSNVKPPQNFVSPSGIFLDHHDNLASSEDNRFQTNVLHTLRATLERSHQGKTSVVYLTSDAGEGKTSTINQLAVDQAEKFKARKSKFLLVPISLEGRVFLRFDDVVFTELVNRLRFQILYFDAFLELVKLGLLVPAFDGFEEVIVESSTGKAISELGHFIRRLDSSGTFLLTACKAYFEYSSFGSQARLFDSIGSGREVVFSRVALNHWGRKEFELYATKRGLTEPQEFYQTVLERLGSKDHPVLTRAVLVTRLIDIAHDEADSRRLLDQLSNGTRHYFHSFVESLIEREANLKWVDTSRDPVRSILTIEQHHKLLAALALEMWVSRTDSLNMDVIYVLVDRFASEYDLSPTVARQINIRLKEHTLLVMSESGRGLRFDHIEFMQFYIGRALGELLVSCDFGEVRFAIENGSVRRQIISQAVNTVRSNDGNLKEILRLLQVLADGEMFASYVKRNCGALAIAIIDSVEEGGFKLHNMIFPVNALAGIELRNTTVFDSYFARTRLVNTQVSDCKFLNCEFERLELDPTARVSKSSIDHRSRVNSVEYGTGEIIFPCFDPERIQHELRAIGFDIGMDRSIDAKKLIDSPDHNLRLAVRFLLGFRRATTLRESMIRRKLGKDSSSFLALLLPKLAIAGVVKEESRGACSQRRFRLAVGMDRIEIALSKSNGHFDSFVSAFSGA